MELKCAKNISLQAFAWTRLQHLQTTSNGCSQPPPRCTGIQGHDDSHLWYVHSSSSIVGLICATNPTKANSRGWPSYMCMLSSSNTIVGPLAGSHPRCVAMFKVSLPLHSVLQPPSLSPSLPPCNLAPLHMPIWKPSHLSQNPSFCLTL